MYIPYLIVEFTIFICVTSLLIFISSHMLTNSFVVKDIYV